MRIEPSHPASRRSSASSIGGTSDICAGQEEASNLDRTVPPPTLIAETTPNEASVRPEWPGHRFYREPIRLSAGETNARAVLEAACDGPGDPVRNVWVILPEGSYAPMCVKRGDDGSMEIALFYEKRERDEETDGETVNDRREITAALMQALGANKKTFSVHRGVRELARHEGETVAGCQQRYLDDLLRVIRGGKFDQLGKALAKTHRENGYGHSKRIRHQPNLVDTFEECRRKTAERRATPPPLKAITVLLRPQEQERTYSLQQSESPDEQIKDLLG